MGVPKLFSFPGACLSASGSKRRAQCKSDHAGVQCLRPDGSKTCTYNLQNLGFVTLEELTGIFQYDKWCQVPGHIEYSQPNDQGFGTSFWDGRHDGGKCAKRVRKLEAIFAKKFPNVSSRLNEPVCDGLWFEGK